MISRSALLEELKEQHDYIMQDPEVGKTMKWCEAVCFHRTVKTVESAPAVDAEKVCEQMGLVKEAMDMAKAYLRPVRHGRWIISSDGYYPYCWDCKARPKGGNMTKYCPNCGAKMDGDFE